MTQQELDALIDHFARQMVARARRMSEQNLREARLPAEQVEEVLDMLDDADVTSYELVVAQLREQLPNMLRAACVETVH